MKKQEEFDFKFKISNAYLGNLVRMNYLPWDALAEWVDNSVQSYLNNQKFLDKRYEKNNECLEIYITYRANQGILKVDDNAGGMTSDLLTKCMEMGDPDPNISKGLSQFNVGLKSAAIWMAKKYEIKTKHFNQEKEYTVSIDNTLLCSANPKDNLKAVKTKSLA